MAGTGLPVPPWPRRRRRRTSDIGSIAPYIRRTRAPAGARQASAIGRALGPSCRERVIERLADFGPPPAPERLQFTHNLGPRRRALGPHRPCQRVVMIHDPDDPRLQRYLVP